MLAFLAVAFWFASAETQWVEERRSECAARQGILAYDKDTQIAECWRYALPRQPHLFYPKLIFRRSYR